MLVLINKIENNLVLQKKKSVTIPPTVLKDLMKKDLMKEIVQAFGGSGF